MYVVEKYIYIYAVCVYHITSYNFRWKFKIHKIPGGPQPSRNKLKKILLYRLVGLGVSCHHPRRLTFGNSSNFGGPKNLKNQM